MSMLKTIGYAFIGIGMAGVAISAVSKIVKLNQEKKEKDLVVPEVPVKTTNDEVETFIIERPRPAKIRHYNELMQRVALHDDRMARSATKKLSTVRKRTRVIIHK